MVQPAAFGDVVSQGATEGVVFTGMIHRFQRLSDDEAGRRLLDVLAIDTSSADQPNAYDYRTFPTSFNNLRSDATNNADISIAKNFHFGERFKLQYRFEAYNALNRPQFAAPNLSPTSKAFATINSQANGSRVIQMGMRLTF